MEKVIDPEIKDFYEMDNIDKVNDPVRGNTTMIKEIILASQCTIAYDLYDDLIAVSIEDMMIRLRKKAMKVGVKLVEEEYKGSPLRLAGVDIVVSDQVSRGKMIVHPADVATLRGVFEHV